MDHILSIAWQQICLQSLVRILEPYVYFNSFLINYFYVILREKELIVLCVSEESIDFLQENLRCWNIWLVNFCSVLFCTYKVYIILNVEFCTACFVINSISTKSPLWAVVFTYQWLMSLVIKQRFLFLFSR